MYIGDKGDDDVKVNSVNLPSFEAEIEFFFEFFNRRFIGRREVYDH